VTHTPSETPVLSLFGSAAHTGLRRWHRTLAWLLAATGAVSIALLLVAMGAGSRSARAFQDVNLSGSLRYRSLWIKSLSQSPALNGRALEMQAPTFVGEEHFELLCPRRRGVAFLKHGGSAPCSWFLYSL